MEAKSLYQTMNTDKDKYKYIDDLIIHSEDEDCSAIIIDINDIVCVRFTDLMVHIYGINVHLKSHKSYGTQVDGLIIKYEVYDIIIDREMVRICHEGCYIGNCQYIKGNNLHEFEESFFNIVFELPSGKKIEMSKLRYHFQPERHYSLPAKISALSLFADFTMCRAKHDIAEVANTTAFYTMEFKMNNYEWKKCQDLMVGLNNEQFMTIININNKLLAYPNNIVVNYELKTGIEYFSIILTYDLLIHKVKDFYNPDGIGAKLAHRSFKTKLI